MCIHVGLNQHVCTIVQCGLPVQFTGRLLLQEYVKNSKHPFLPLTRVAQGQLLESFESALDDKVAVSYV